MTKLLFVLTLLVPTFAHADDPSGAAEIFEQLKRLEGVWEKEGASDSRFNISFELTANDSVLVETWNHDGKKHSLTVYHLDGNDLIATHYCPQGNQPRLRMVNNSSTRNISFEYLDATNLESIHDSHQHSLGFVLNETLDRVQRKESYLGKAGEKPSEMVLIRK